MTLYAEWSAPANMLIAGEYAITRPGGNGISVATSPRGHVRLYRLDDTEGVTASAGKGTVEVIALMGGKPLVHREGTPLPLVAAVRETILGDPSLPISGRWRIELDTQAFFDPQTGSKLGLGSSAVATLLLTAAFQEVVGNNSRSRRFKEDRVFHDSGLEETITTALHAHRLAHGGRGSGYDVITSALGGAIRFTGGETPHWTSVFFLERFVSHGGALYTWQSGKPVSSQSAVTCFEAQVPRASSREATVLKENNTVIDKIQRSGGWRELFRALCDAARFGVTLGDEIGVSAQLPFVASHLDDGWISKASGAGNERGIIFATSSPRRPLPRGTTPANIETEGLVCRYHIR